ncbi:MAG: c-type cytochrome [Saprospiraceae bacterium]|nr:c-type cytochrome [Saprospiraceae bacterium]
MIYKSLLIRLSGAILLVCLALPTIAQSSPDVGKTLFRNYCASCHNKNMRQALTGPALGGVQERWVDYPIEDLYEWIRNSQALIDAGHPRALQVYNENNKVLMQAFPNLTDEDIGSLLLYIDGIYEGTYGVAATQADGSGASQGQTESSNNVYYYIIFGFLLVLSLVLARIYNNLKYLAAVKEGKDIEAPPTLWSSLMTKGTVSMVIFALVMFGGYTTVNNAIGLNRQQEYGPEQPIKFSHTTHAGLNQIDCQYCHDGARRSKHSVIPATNTCMNCHRAIKIGSQYGTGELIKIFASIGYDPSKDIYIEDYDQMSEDDIKKIYTTWIANEYVAENGLLDRRGERQMEEQWEGVVSSLTSETKSNIQGPIEWIRIHNLPDHAYFNHSQHVSVGKVECQTCHGPVEEMEVVKQWAPLSMGWCVNCHRDTEVQFASNPYYASYEQYHEELKAGIREKVTVEEIGGLECQKCHY